MPGPQPCHCIPFIFCIVGRGLDPSGGVGDAAPYILGRELSANRRGIHLSRFLARISLTFFFTFHAKYATIYMYIYKNKEKERSLCLLSSTGGS